MCQVSELEQKKESKTDVQKEVKAGEKRLAVSTKLKNAM